MLFSMVFQTLSVILSKTSNEAGNNTDLQAACGEFLSTVSQVYLYNGITKFTATWFDNKVRPIATGIIIFGAQIAKYTILWIILYVINVPI